MSDTKDSGREQTCHVCGGNGIINGPDIQGDDRVPPFVCDHCGGTGKARYVGTDT